MRLCICLIFLSAWTLSEVAGFEVVYNGGSRSSRYHSLRPTSPFNKGVEQSSQVSLGKQKSQYRPNNDFGNSRAPLTLGIILYDNVEVLDVCGPFEVLAIAGERSNGSLKVLMIGDQKFMRAQNGLMIVADYVYDDPRLPKLDVLLVPGTTSQWTRDFINNRPVMNWIKRVEPKLKYLLSVCTGASVIAKLGFVDGLQVTTHHQAFDLLAEFGPRVKPRRDCRYTDNGRVLTSAGISAGIDLSLYFVSKIFGQSEALGIQDRMEYLGRWNEVSSTCLPGAGSGYS